MCKFKSGDSTNIGVAVKMKFDPEELPEKVSVGTGLKRQAETRNWNDAWADQSGLILAHTM